MLTSLVAQMVMSLPAMQETWVRSLAWEDLLEKEMAPHFSILGSSIHGIFQPRILQYSWLENPMDGGAWQTTVHGVTESWT